MAIEYLWSVFLFLLINTTAGIGTVPSGCTFPTEWQGYWYDSLLKEIRITETTISKKGTCMQREDMRFLMLNRGSTNRKCFICVIFTPWHANLLQYKESQCWHKENLDEVCKEIGSDIPLQTVVKIGSIPEPCPFQGSYTFSYTNGSIECHQPPSQLRACADNTKFRFVYKKCNGIPETSNQELEFQCLASWESGDKYLYGKFVRLNTTNHESFYRCFMPSFYGTLGDMSMSADATCQGLQSPSLGVLNMKFNKDLQSHIRGSCKFPTFLTQQQRWRDLTGQVIIDVEVGLDVLRIRDRKEPGVITYTESFDTSDTREVFRCVSGFKNTDLQFIAYSTNNECMSSKKCLLFKTRTHGVIELLVGAFSTTSDISCQFDDAIQYLIIPEMQDSCKFPSVLSGIYQYTDKAADCKGEINIGCLTDGEMIVETSCSNNRKSVNILECLQQWQEGSVVYVIVKTSGEDAKPLMCLTFVDTEFGLDVQNSSHCRSDRRVVINQSLNYLLYKPQIQCHKDHVDLQSDQNSNDDGGGRRDGSLINADKKTNSAYRFTNAISVRCIFVMYFIYVLLNNCNECKNVER